MQREKEERKRGREKGREDGRKEGREGRREGGGGKEFPPFNNEKNPIEEWAKTISTRIHSQSAHEKILSIIPPVEMQITDTMRCHFIPTQLAIIKKEEESSGKL